MYYCDKVYGGIEILEPVLIELINSKPIQRLKGIMNAGVVYKVKPWKNFTRYDHSMGVMVLLNQKGASLEEQIAGLLHDVPHTAFSHAVDFVFKVSTHDYHERFHEKIVLGSEIPQILKKYGFDIERIMEEKNFPLLEQEAPDLCADRIDYTLREFVARDGYSQKITNYLKSIVVNDNLFVFDDGLLAKQFSIEFLEMVQSWGTPLELTIVEIIAQAIRVALDEKIINENDLFTTDDQVLEKLEKSKNKEIHDLLALLNPKLKVISDENDYDYFSKEKVRLIDPIIIPENERVSQIYKSYSKLLNEHKIIMSKGNYAKIIKN